jgi:hypothetical protein
VIHVVLRCRAVVLALALAGCGGGGGGGGGGDPYDPPDGPRPDVVLLVVSGHSFGADPAYLRFDAGPELEAGLAGAGYDVRTLYYVDGASTQDGFGGFSGLVADMEFLRDEWVPEGTRVVVVAHSHGGVWAHAAIREVPGLPVRALVDLDTSSFGWALVGHDGEDGPIGGDPSDVYALGALADPPAYPDVPSEQTTTYDLEDVVFDNVEDALEVRTGDAPFDEEWYDEKWNLRTTGAADGLWVHFSDDTHAEAHAAGGATMALVGDWVEARLAE